MTTLKLSLEWFLNPDHLPFIAGIGTGAYQSQGIELEIIVPQEHYDGFEALRSGEIDLHCNEPLHLFEHYFEGIRSLGCFFETRGGVMMRESSVEKLRTNQPIRITTPAANEVTNTIGFEILRRYANSEGFTIDKKCVEFVQNDFYHIANMKQDPSLDGAWLCFYNFEGIEAQMEGFANLFIDQYESPYPNFSALELMCSDEILTQKGEAIGKFIEVTHQMIEDIRADKDKAKRLYYHHTQEEPSELMDRIIEDTLHRFDSHFTPNRHKWKELHTFLRGLGIVDLTSQAYGSIWGR